MIGASRTEYYFIQVCIIGLHYLAPLCILYCLLVVGFYGFKATRYPVPLAIECLALAETLFFLLVYLPYRKYLQREAVHPPPLSKEDRRELFDLCNDNIPDHEEYLEKWFLGARSEDVKRENVKEFFLWAFFDRGGPPGNDDEELEEMLKATEAHLGRKIEPGRGSAKCLRLTLDNAEMLHRSLVWYFCVGFVDLLTYIRLLSLGFTFYRSAFSRFLQLFPFRFQALLATNQSPAENLTYWYRPHTSKTKLPILFIHGIGIGLYPYVNLLKDLNSTHGLESADPNDQVGIIALEIMPVAFRITNAALSKTEMCTQIKQILDHHGWSKIVLVSHSYGTVVSTHLLKTPSTAQLIGPIVLIDPVSILLHLPDVAYNFTRRKPERANEHQLYYFASMDCSVSNTLSRHFFWSENILWKKDFNGHDVTVSLSGKDLIVNTEAVGTYMSEKETSLTPKKDSDGLLPGINSQHLENAIENDTAVEIDSEDVVGGLAPWKSRSWKGTGTDILWFDNLDHAQVFDKPATRRPLVMAIRRYCEQGHPAVSVEE